CRPEIKVKLVSRALAAAGLGALVAAPQTGSAEVQLYGSLFSTIEGVESRGATSRADGGSGHTYGSSYRLSSHSSYFGLRGTEKLSDDLNAFFQLENSVNIATGTGTIGGRNTGVGLKSASWGTIVLGNWDSPLKLSSVRADPWRTKTVAGYNNLISTPGFGIGKQRLGK